MRKFYLELDGTRIPLNNEPSFNNTMSIMFANPQGLGLTLDTTYVSIQNGFFYRSKTEQQQNEIAGSLLIFGDPYNNYLTFANALLGATNIIFIYKPDGDNANGIEYRAKVFVSYVTKSESVGNEFMVVPIAFKVEGLWYRDYYYYSLNQNYVDLPSSNQTGYGVKFYTTNESPTPQEETTTGDLEEETLDSESSSNEGTELVNPTIIFRVWDDQQRTTYHDYINFTISTTIPATSTLEYSSYYDDSYLIMRDSQGVITDLVPYTSSNTSIFTHDNSACSVIIQNTTAYPADFITVIQRTYWRTV